MSMVEDLKDLKGIKGILVQHNTFSYLIKSLFYLPDDDKELQESGNLDSCNDDKPWSVTVFSNGSVPELSDSDYYPIRALPKENGEPSHFKLLLLNDLNQVCLTVKSQELYHCVEVIINEMSSLNPTKLHVISSQECGYIKDPIDKIKSSRDESSDQECEDKEIIKGTTKKKSASSKSSKKTDIKSTMSFDKFLTTVLVSCVILVLTHTSIISGQLRSIMNNSTVLRLDVKNFKTSETDKLFVKTITSVYAIAMNSNLTEVADKCAEFLKDYANDEDVLDILELALIENNESLKNFAVKLLPANGSSIYNSSKWQNIIQISINNAFNFTTTVAKGISII